MGWNREREREKERERERERGKKERGDGQYGSNMYKQIGLWMIDNYYIKSNKFK